MILAIFFLGNVLATKFKNCLEPEQDGTYYLKVVTETAYKELKKEKGDEVDPFYQDYGKVEVLTYGNGVNADLKSVEKVKESEKKSKHQMTVTVELHADQPKKFRLKTREQKKGDSMRLSMNAGYWLGGYKFNWNSGDKGGDGWFSYTKDNLKMSFEGRQAKGYPKGLIGTNGIALYPKDDKSSKPAMFCFTQSLTQTEQNIEELTPPPRTPTPTPRSNSNDNPVDVPATEEDIEKLIRKWAEEIEEFEKLEEDEKKEVVKKGQELEVLKLLKDQKLALSAFEKEKEAVVPELKKFVDELKDSGAFEFAVFAVISLATLLF